MEDIRSMYPVILLPKGCTLLKPNYETNDNVLLDLAITTLTTKGETCCIYSGTCYIKFVENHGVLNQHKHTPTIEVTGTYDKDEIQPVEMNNQLSFPSSSQSHENSSIIQSPSNELPIGTSYNCQPDTRNILLENDPLESGVDEYKHFIDNLRVVSHKPRNCGNAIEENRIESKETTERGHLFPANTPYHQNSTARKITSFKEICKVCARTFYEEGELIKHLEDDAFLYFQNYMKLL